MELLSAEWNVMYRNDGSGRCMTTATKPSPRQKRDCWSAKTKARIMPTSHKSVSIANAVDLDAQKVAEIMAPVARGAA
jgi:hypothetical protein